MSDTVKAIVGFGVMAFMLVFVCFFTIMARQNLPVSSDGKEMNTEVAEVNKSEIGDFVTKGNWTVFKFENHPRQLFDIGLIPEISDRFEKEHPKLRLQNGDWQVVYNPMNSHPYGILFRHYPTN